MNILCLFAKHPRSITSDLAKALINRGHTVTIVVPQERKLGKSTQLSSVDDCEVLRVKSGNLFDTVNKYEKFIATSRLPRILYNSIIKHFGSRKFDLVITHTPFLADGWLNTKLKGHFDCKSLLLLWDIFPQNAIDLEMLKKDSFLHHYLSRKEEKMLKSFDAINCMSQGNKDYILKHYHYLKDKHLLVNYNWATINTLTQTNTRMMREEYGYSPDDKICMFGGNVGKPQAIHNLLLLVEKLPEIQFLFAIRGTESAHVKQAAEKFTNLRVLDFIASEHYQQVLAMCDVGLISLDERFTVPNFPSKTIEYFQCGLPVFALLDPCSAADYGKFIQENKVGTHIAANNVENEYCQLREMLFNDTLLNDYKANTSKVYAETFNVECAVDDLLACAQHTV